MNFWSKIKDRIVEALRTSKNNGLFFLKMYSIGRVIPRLSKNDIIEKNKCPQRDWICFKVKHSWKEFSIFTPIMENALKYELQSTSFEKLLPEGL